MITNKSKETLTVEDAMLRHKGQYKSEHLNRRAKSGFRLEPIYLQKAKRIEAYLFLFKIALQLIVLIERTTRNNIDKRGKGLDNFRPNKKDVKNPKAEYLLKEFQQIMLCYIFSQTEVIQYFVSELNTLQRDILELLEVPLSCYTYEFLFNTS
jgi:transposase